MSASLPNSRATLNQPPMDWWLVALTLILVSLGLIMVFSASFIFAEYKRADTYFFFKRQLLFTVVGLGVMAVVAMMRRETLYKLQYPALFGVFLLLVLTNSPLATTVKGAHRWLNIGPFSLQPMEFAKIALVMYLAYFMASKQDIIKTFSKGVIPPFLVTGLMCGLLLLQPDFGGAAIMLLLLFIMCLVGGTRPIYLATSALLACGAAYLLITNAEYRLDRITAFLRPFEVADKEGYHLVQSFYAFGTGGLFGSGLGASHQKLFFLPEAHNDFILAVFGEETGLVGITIFFMLMGAFYWRGLKIALAQSDLRDRFTAFGVVLILLLSTVLNMAVVLGVAPPKGVPMPFFSYGGSSMLASLICVGLLLNISRTGRG